MTKVKKNPQRRGRTRSISFTGKGNKALETMESKYGKGERGFVSRFVESCVLDMIERIRTGKAKVNESHVSQIED